MPDCNSNNIWWESYLRHGVRAFIEYPSSKPVAFLFVCFGERWNF